MRTRREQVQAYQFVIRRIVSALLSGEPEASEQPMRRLRLSLLASTMVAAIVLAAAGIFGLLTNQSSPLEPNTLVIEEGTEARYVYVEDASGELRLHPVLNYASARLVLGEPDPTVREVSADVLRDLPRGTQVGIPDAPDSLPEADQLAGLPWRICSVPPDVDDPDPTTTAVIGRELPGASPPGEQGLYVTDGQERYLLWNDRLLRIAEPVVLVALRLSGIEPVVVGEPLINSVLAGPDLQVLLPEGFGEPSDIDVAAGEELVGFVYQAAGEHYMLTRGGLVPVGEFTVALRRADANVAVRQITGGQATLALSDDRRLEPEGFPQAVPQLHPASEGTPTVCAAYQGAGEGALATTVEVFDTARDELASSAPEVVQAVQTERDVVATVNQVLLTGGRGALVHAVSAADATAAGSTYLVTARGIKYPLGTASGDARGALGYGEVSPIPVPAALADLIPTGPALEVADARLPGDSGGTVEGATPDEATG